MAEAPALEIAALSAEKLSILTGPPNVGTETQSGPSGTAFEYAPDGSLYVHCAGSAVSFNRDPATDPIKCKADSPVARLCFSPQGTYCVTHEAVIERLGQQHKNLKIWRTSDGALLATFHKRNITNDTWPALQFDAAETHVFFVVKDAIVLYDLAGEMTKAARKVKMEGVSHFAMSPGKRKVLATFTPESAKPAVFATVEWDEGTGTATNRKQFYRATRCCLFWNSKGTHVCCQSIADFDATNQSYFGESRLYLLSIDGKVDTAITMNQDTNIVDVGWNPAGTEFVAIGGHQPATAALFDVRGKAICTICQGPFNTVRWNPQGRFVLLAGFGNLPGDIQLFERGEGGDKSCARMGATRSECSVLVEWSPCGRYFLTASVAPRMRVDNRITVFTYYAKEVHTIEYEELRAAHWKPQPVDRYPDRGQSPERLKEVAQSKAKGVNITAPQQKAAYVPPSQRGNGVQDAKEAKGFDADMAADRIRALQRKKQASKRPEGMDEEDAAPAGKNMSKSAKKRAAKKVKPASEGAGSETGDAAAEPAAVAEVTEGTAAMAINGDAGADPAKRLRNLRKRLAKIETAKEKRAQGQVMTPEQEEGIASEEGVRAEMRELGASGA